MLYYMEDFWYKVHYNYVSSILQNMLPYVRMGKNCLSKSEKAMCTETLPVVCRAQVKY